MTNTNSHKEPLVRVVKRAELTNKQIVLLRFGAVLFSLLAGAVFILLIGENPIAVYKTIVVGAFRSKMAIQATVKLTIPLLITALAVTLAFKMKFWNIGAEGQMIMGAVFASFFALNFSGINHYLLIVIMFVAAVIGGGLWGLIPAVFKVKYNTNETLFTLMLNYIALYIIAFLRDGPWKDPGAQGYLKIARFNDNVQLDNVLGIQMGWVVALVLVVIVYFYIKYSKHGYEISVVGDSQNTAKYAGMSVPKIVIRTMFISGAIAGLAGMIKATGSDMTLTTAVAGGIGFTAIIVAWLAQLNPFMITVVSLLFSVLEKGSSVAKTQFGFSADCADVLQGIILFFILGCEFFVRYKFLLRNNAKER